MLPYLDNVLVMTVNPGFGGQAFLPQMLPKIARLRAMLDDAGCDTDLEVDGGIKPGTAAECARAGANAFVAGSAIYNTDDYSAAIAAIRDDAAGGQRR